MKTTISILVRGGLIQGVYNILNAKQTGIIIVDDDNLMQSSDRETEALEQLTPYQLDGDVEYKEIHTILFNHIDSEDIDYTILG